MRALALFATQLITGNAPTAKDRSSRPSDPLPELDDATLRAWRAWASEAPDAGPPATGETRRDPVPSGIRPSARTSLIGEG